MGKLVYHDVERAIGTAKAFLAKQVVKVDYVVMATQQPLTLSF
jgi:hypothetical protein